MDSTILKAFIMYIMCISISTNALPLQRTGHFVDRRNADPVGNIRSIVLHPRSKRTVLKLDFRSLTPSVYSGSRRKRQYYDNEDEYVDEDYEYVYPPGFYPYRNIGSLYVDGKNVEITSPLYNYGVDSYPSPIYGPYAPY